MSSISSIYSQQAQSTGLDDLFGIGKKQDEQQEQGKSGVYSWKQDSVSFSSEAMSQAASMQNNSGESTGDGAQNSNASLSAGAGGGVGGAAKKDNSSIEKQITALQEQMAAIQGSSLPDGTKSAMISGIQAQISALMAQMTA